MDFAPPRVALSTMHVPGRVPERTVARVKALVAVFETVLQEMASNHRELRR
jgi:hypothetical protein